jgi:hypothetical protein
MGKKMGGGGGEEEAGLAIAEHLWLFKFGLSLILLF